jgi:hypothetical protein
MAVIAPVAALVGIFVGQGLQKRRELSVRAQQLREEMLLDLAEWTLKQTALVPTPSIHTGADGTLKAVIWPTNAAAADRELIAEQAPPRLLMLVRLYGSPKLFELARSASSYARESGSIAGSRRDDIVGPSVYYQAIVALQKLWAQIETEVAKPPRRRPGLFERVKLTASRSPIAGETSTNEDQRNYNALLADEEWWHVETREGVRREDDSPEI